MYYYKKEGDIIEKYNLTFDSQKIEDLKEEIILNCSEIHHKEYRSDYCPQFSKNDIIRNLKSSPTKEYEGINLYSYDVYIPPYLVNIINKLLDNDISALDELLYYSEYEDLTISKKVKQIKEKLKTVSTLDSNNRQYQLHKLKMIFELLKFKKIEQKIGDYYRVLFKYINITFIDEIDIEELRRIEKFLNTQILSKTLKDSNNDDKRLKKILIK